MLLIAEGAIRPAHKNLVARESFKEGEISQGISGAQIFCLLF
jgi:hypothetical protein